MYPYEYQAHPDIDQTAYMDAWKKYHKTACTRKTCTCSSIVFLSCIHMSIKHILTSTRLLICLPEGEHLDARNMSKTLQLNYKINVKKYAFCWFLLHCCNVNFCSLNSMRSFFLIHWLDYGENDRRFVVRFPVGPRISLSSQKSISFLGAITFVEHFQ